MVKLKKIATEKLREADVANQYTGETWVYSDAVKDHFFNPRNLLLDQPADGYFDAEGMVGSPACGDMMTMWSVVLMLSGVISKRFFGSRAKAIVAWLDLLDTLIN
jgi:hypothetical protein